MRATLRRWERGGFGGLWESPGRGAKPKWQAADLEAVEPWIEQAARTYNRYQLAPKLATERQVQLSPRRVRYSLQTRAFDGSGHGTVTEGSKTLSKSGSNKLTSIR